MENLLRRIPAVARSISDTAVNNAIHLRASSTRSLLIKDRVMIETGTWKEANRTSPYFIFHHSFGTGFTSIHSEKTSSEYAKLRKQTLESKFGSILGTESSKNLLSYFRFGPFLALYRAAVISFHMVKLSAWHFFLQDIHKRAEKFRETLISLGPFYIKLGQALSTRPDILPSAYCQELSKLQDRIPPFPTQVAIKSIESQLGLPISQIFADISSKPVASASLGQVYKAYLKSGELVAVKVQRPGMSLVLTLDALLFNMIGGQLKRFAKARKDLLVAVNEMVRHMFEEIDYILEAENAERFATLYASHPSSNQHIQKKKPGVKVPKIFWSFTRKEVLTMEWIDGIKLTDADRISKAHLNRKELVNQGLDCSLRQMLEEGFFHGDPHPGNLVATDDGSLAYFDFGMMGNIPRHYRVGLIQVLVHYVNRDSFGLANDFLSLGFIPDGANLSSVADALQATFGDGTGHSKDFQVAAISEQASQSLDDNTSESSVPNWKSFDMRAVVAATEDLLCFILTEKGLRVRVFLVQDILKASNVFLREQIHPCVSDMSTERINTEEDLVVIRIINGLRSLHQAIKLAPEIWTGMLIRMILKPEVHIFAFDIIAALSRHSCHEISTSFWLCVSKFLHSLQEHNTVQDS